MRITYNDRAYESFAAAVPANLVGKEGYLVELIPGTRTIQLYSATAGIQPIGTLFERLEGDTNWSVRMLGKAASCRMVASGNIRAGYGVKPVNGGTVIEAASTNTIVGVMLSGTGATNNAVANDFIEVADGLGVAF